MSKKRKGQNLSLEYQGDDLFISFLAYLRAMKNFLIFSDIHIYKHLSRTIFEDIGINFLYHVVDYCKENDIKDVIFGGDFFHVKSKIYVPSYIRALEALEEANKNGINMRFLIGNHDMPLLNTTDFSIIHSFNKHGHVIKDYEWEDVDGTRIHYLSYTHELPEWEMGPGKNVLIGHLDILDFVMESGMVCREGFQKEDFSQFDQVFSGHFHKHQSVNNICYIGSPYQTRYSERFDKKGFITFKPATVDWEFHVYQKAPVFKEVDYENFEDKDVIGNFVRVKTHKDNVDLNEIKEDLLLKGAQSVDFIFETNDNELNDEVLEDFSLGSIEDLASQYFDAMLDNEKLEAAILEMIKNDEIDKKYFMEAFKEIQNAYLQGWKPEDEEMDILK